MLKLSVSGETYLNQTITPGRATSLIVSWQGRVKLDPTVTVSRIVRRRKFLFLVTCVVSWLVVVDGGPSHYHSLNRLNLQISKIIKNLV